MLCHMSYILVDGVSGILRTFQVPPRAVLLNSMRRSTC